MNKQMLMAMMAQQRGGAGAMPRLGGSPMDAMMPAPQSLYRAPGLANPGNAGQAPNDLMAGLGGLAGLGGGLIYDAVRGDPNMPSAAGMEGVIPGMSGADARSYMQEQNPYSTLGKFNKWLGGLF